MCTDATMHTITHTYTQYFVQLLSHLQVINASQKQKLFLQSKYSPVLLLTLHWHAHAAALPASVGK